MAAWLEKSDMDLAKVISELRSQRDDIDRAIQSLEALALVKTKRRGRPKAGQEPDRTETSADIALSGKA